MICGRTSKTVVCCDYTLCLLSVRQSFTQNTCHQDIDSEVDDVSVCELPAYLSTGIIHHRCGSSAACRASTAEDLVLYQSAFAFHVFYLIYRLMYQSSMYITSKT